MDRSNQDAVGDKCIQNADESLSDSKKLEARVEHYSRLPNVEFDWPSKALNEVPAVACPSPMVTVDHKKPTFCMFLVPEKCTTN